MDMDLIPTDVMLEILSRLPAKSAIRFRCVSKLWGSMLNRPYFTELFLTRSSARPRLIFGVVKRNGELLLYSSPQPRNLYKNSSLVVAADFHLKFSVDNNNCGYNCEYTSGLIYFPRKYKDAMPVICNPVTGQYATLPVGKEYIRCKSFLGFDPIDNQFKVLRMHNNLRKDWDNYILTLGTGNMWRKIQCPLTHYPVREGICINGFLYYLAELADELSDKKSYAIVCFDVRTEKFKFIDAECYYHKLINYKGKVCGIKLEYAYDGGFPLKLSLWVLEDVEKQEWSNYSYCLEVKNVKANCNLSVVGMTARGEIVLVKEDAFKPFYVFYFNPERNTLQSVEIQGVGEVQKWSNIDIVFGFVDHVEDLNFDIM
ncbi:putative F-box protein At1g30925 [Arabidopsis lyrata subsp. lyrata]|uniref:putative F-box protein At1g30925 n=1 Tax=Arabidopsis lyrata subsp. lyrata TaxID=81972 RepID=UPI000A29D194|nr:putative F-box protein At1g30925 [Arabidopsis lyrata subsp. lyrata]|eukprot:XP_020866341.1 putative F-box protein At1g30925 [Arabidopsis lyrata subsp. lyrata]